MARSARRPGRHAGAATARLENLPNVGPAIAADLRRLGITEPAQLATCDPYALYDRLNACTGMRHDPCVLDTFIAAVRFMKGEPPRRWWTYSAERKRVLTQRNESPTPRTDATRKHGAELQATA